MAEERPDRTVQDAKPETPLWVKVFAVLFVMLLLLLVVMLLAGHGPGDHASGIAFPVL